MVLNSEIRFAGTTHELVAVYKATSVPDGSVSVHTNSLELYVSYRYGLSCIPTPLDQAT
jgi:hypothetical protein